MLYKFQSQATESFVMMEGNARALLEIIGKSSSKGIITVEQIPAAISALERAIGSDAESNRHNRDAFAAEDHAEDAERQHVGLHQRATPLLHMLKRSLEAGKDVIWGV